MKINPKKISAIKLRKKGGSYNKIAKSLNVQKSTIAYWFKEIDWSRDIKKQLTERAQKISTNRLIRLNKSRKIKWAKWYRKADDEAIGEFQSFKDKPLFIAGIMIYWGEGSKTLKSSVRISNTDPKMLFVFNQFLKEICKVDVARVKAWLLLYPDLNHVECLEFWSRHVSISKENFYKSTVITGKHKSRRLSYGVCSISVASYYLQRKMLKWIDLFTDQCNAGVV